MKPVVVEIVFFATKFFLSSVVLPKPKLSILQRRQLFCNQIKVFGLGVANKVLLQHPSDNHHYHDDDDDENHHRKISASSASRMLCLIQICTFASTFTLSPTFCLKPCQSLRVSAGQVIKRPGSSCKPSSSNEGSTYCRLRLNPCVIAVGLYTMYYCQTLARVNLTIF